MHNIGEMNKENVYFIFLLFHHNNKIILIFFIIMVRHLKIDENEIVKLILVFLNKLIYRLT